MRLPSPDLSPDERALLECLARFESAAPPYSLPLAQVRESCRTADGPLDAMRVRTVVWGLRDPRRFTADLAFLDERYVPPLLRLTPDGLEALAGDVPNEPKLLAAIASGVERKADPNAVDQVLFHASSTKSQRAA